MKIKHFTAATLAALMCLSSSMMNVFADDTSTDDHTTNINYTVEESYKWQAPADLIFTKNIDNEVLTGSVSVLENIIEATKTLVISIGPGEDFKLTSAEGATRDYTVSKDSEVLSAGSRVLLVPSGTYSGAQDLDFELQGVVSGNTSQKAGVYTGTLNFVANIETTGSGSGSGGESGGGSGGGSGVTDIVSAGTLITVENIDANGDSVTDIFRVLSINGNQAFLYTMDGYKMSEFGSSKTYAGSTLDNEMTNYYNVLPNNVQNAIIEQDIYQSTYSHPSDTVKIDTIDPNDKAFYVNSSSDKTDNYILLELTNSTHIGNRKVFALDFEDLFDIFGNHITKEQAYNYIQGVGVKGAVSCWMRSSTVDNPWVMMLFGGVGANISPCGNLVYVRPAFVIDLSQVNFAIVQ